MLHGLFYNAGVGNYSIHSGRKDGKPTGAPVTTWTFEGELATVAKVMKAVGLPLAVVDVIATKKCDHKSGVRHAGGELYRCKECGAAVEVKTEQRQLF